MLVKLDIIAGYNSEFTTTVPEDRFDSAIVSLVETGNKEEDFLLDTKWVFVVQDPNDGFRHYLHTGDISEANVRFDVDVSNLVDEPTAVSSSGLAEELSNLCLDAVLQDFGLEDHEDNIRLTTHFLPDATPLCTMTCLTVIELTASFNDVGDKILGALRELGVESCGWVIYDVTTMIRTLGGLVLGQPMITHYVEGINNTDTINIIIYDAGTYMKDILEPIRFPDVMKINEEYRKTLDEA